MPPDADASEARAMLALERFLVRQVVYSLLGPFLSADTEFDPRGDSLPAKTLRKLAECPLFRGPSTTTQSSADEALSRLFQLLPRIDRVLKQASRRGMDRVLTSLICGPVLAQFEPPRSSPRSDLSAALRALLGEITVPGGTALLLEEIKSMHFVDELRPSVRLLLDRLKRAVASSLFRDVSDENKRRKMAHTFSQVPRVTIIRVLKLNIFSGSVLMAIWSIFTSSSVTSQSLLQKLVISAVGLDLAQKQMEECRARLAPVWLPFLDAFNFVPVDYSQPEGVRKRRDALVEAINIASPDCCVEGEAQAWDALWYCQLRVQIKSARAIVELAGDAEVLSACHHLLSLGHRHVLGPAFAKSSGLVHLAEVFFSAWERLVTSWPSTLENVLSLVNEVCGALLPVIKRMLINDSSLMLHQTFAWVVGLYAKAKEASLQLPDFFALVNALPPDQQAAIRSEAQQLLERERFNAARPYGVPRVPRPQLKASQVLADMLVARNGIWDRMVAPVGDLATSELVLRRSLPPFGVCWPIANIEVTYSFETSDLAQRGFSKAGEAGAATLWIRRRDPEFDLESAPITNVALAPNSVLPSEDWVLIRRNLNKTTGGPRVFVLYSRHHEGSAPGTVLVGLCFIGVEAREQMLIRGWRQVGSTKQGRFFQTELALFGLYSSGG